MPCSLLCLVGLPGSGKSTLASAIKNASSGHTCSVLTIEYDVYIDVETFSSKGSWKISRRKLLEEVQRTCDGLHREIRPSVIILDDNFYYKSMRYEVFQIARTHKFGFGQIFINTPVDQCVERNSSRKNPVPVDVLLKINSLIEPPDPFKNYWETFSLTFNSFPDIDLIFELISRTLTRPFGIEPRIDEPHNNSPVHYVDLALRQIVKNKISSAAPYSKSTLCKILASKKKNILDDVRTGIIVLPPGTVGPDSLSDLVNFLEPFFDNLSTLS